MLKRFLLICGSLLLLAGCGEPPVSTRYPAGNPNAPISVVEVSDFQCPFCADFHNNVAKDLLKKYGNQIRYEMMHFPLTNHAFALPAAISAECAADQGKFWEYVDTAFTNQNSLSIKSLTDWAEQLGLDIETFKDCQKSNEKKNVVLNDFKEARTAGIKGTPTIFLNGRQVPTNELINQVEAALNAGANMPL